MGMAHRIKYSRGYPKKMRNQGSEIKGAGAKDNFFFFFFLINFICLFEREDA